MPRLLVLNHIVLLLCCSIYIGIGVMLVFFQFPLEPQITINNYYLIFVEPVAHATRFLTYMTILMLICAVLMLATEWFSGLRWVPLVVLLGVIAATLVTTQFLFPINNEMAAHITDPERLTVVLAKWMNLNRLRVFLWFVQWSAMAYWFYRMALAARSDR